jgi:membrane-bound metal-dependent hydrolase YbcI (DUF457 family)
MPLPVAHAIVGASIVAALRDNFSLRRDWSAMILGAALAIMPDLDLFFSWVLGYGLRVHGGISHSIVFALGIGSLASLLTREESVKGVLGYTGAILSHGLLDAATKKEFGGSELLWPISNDRYKLGLIPDYEFYPDPNSQPVAEIFRQAALFGGYELIFYLPLLLIVLFLKAHRRY